MLLWVSKSQDLTTGRWYEVGDKLAREKVGQALREAIKQRNQPRPESPLSQHASGSDCDDRKESSSMKKPSAKGQRRLSARDRELLLKTFDEKNNEPDDTTKPNTTGSNSSSSKTQQQQKQAKKKRQRNSDPSLKLPRIIDTDMKMLPYLKQKDSDESGSLSDLIGASALFTGQQDSMSVSSSIFSATDEIELNEPSDAPLAPGDETDDATGTAAAKEFDLARLHQRQRKQGQDRSSSSSSKKRKKKTPQAKSSTKTSKR